MEKVEMHVPNKAYDGYYGGVRFHKGVGVFTDVKLAKDLAKRFGYEIVVPEGEKKETKKSTSTKKAPAKKKTTTRKPKPKEEKAGE